MLSLSCQIKQGLVKLDVIEKYVLTATRIWQSRFLSTGNEDFLKSIYNHHNISHIWKLGSSTVFLPSMIVQYE